MDINNIDFAGIKKECQYNFRCIFGMKFKKKNVLLKLYVSKKVVYSVRCKILGQRRNTFSRRHRQQKWKEVGQASLSRPAGHEGGTVEFARHPIP